MAELTGNLVSAACGFTKSAISKGIKHKVNKSLSDGGNSASEKCMLLENIREIVQNDQEKIIEKQISFAERDLIVAEQIVCETVGCMGHNFAISDIGFNFPALELTIPRELEWKFDLADINAKKIFSDKKCCTPKMRCRALRVQIFCILFKYYRKNEGYCVKMLTELFKWINEDMQIKEGLTILYNNAVTNIFGQDEQERQAVKVFYKHCRTGVCKLILSNKRENALDFSHLVQAFFNLHSKRTLEQTKTIFGVDGLVLSGFQAEKLIFLTLGQSLYQIGNNVIVKNVSDKFNITLEINLNQIDVTLKQESKIEINGTKKKLSDGFLKNLKMVASRGSLVTYGLVSITKYAEVSTTCNDGKLTIRWLQGRENGEKCYLLKEFPKKFAEKMGKILHTDSEEKELSIEIYKRISVCYAEDEIEENTVGIFMKILTKQETHEYTLFKIVCNSCNGVQKVYQLCKIILPENVLHRMVWLEKLNTLELVYISDANSLKFTYCKFQRNVLFKKSCATVKEIDIFPPCSVDCSFFSN